MGRNGVEDTVPLHREFFFLVAIAKVFDFEVQLGIWENKRSCMVKKEDRSLT